MLRIMMLLAKARNDVMLPHYAVRRNIIHEVNTDEVNTIWREPFLCGITPFW